ncbi:MAG: YdeI/OmpD-associated family protein, partial [Chloroflexota bacterium]
SVWFTPRLPSTPWSKRSKQRALDLIAAGRMADPGLRTVVTSQKDGTWTRLDRADSLELPGDLVLRLNRDKRARAGWLKLPAKTHREIVAWIMSATREGTRQERLLRTIDAARRGESPLDLESP